MTLRLSMGLAVALLTVPAMATNDLFDRVKRGPAQS